MPIDIACDICSNHFSVRSVYAGKTIQCPKCQNDIIVTQPYKEVDAVKCYDCNKTRQDSNWQPTDTCPDCGSERYYPEGMTRPLPKIALKLFGEGHTWHYSPKLGLAALVAAIIFFSIVIRQIYWPSGTLPPLDLKCTACDRVSFESPEGTTPPWACRECGQPSVYRARRCVACLNDSAIKPLNIPTEQLHCPSCKTAFHDTNGDRRCDKCNSVIETPIYGYCCDCDHIWKTSATYEAPENMPKECPQCKSRDITDTISYHSRCPECGGTKFKSITPIENRRN